MGPGEVILVRSRNDCPFLISPGTSFGMSKFPQFEFPQSESAQSENDFLMEI
jgi:hypothetical protein